MSSWPASTGLMKRDCEGTLRQLAECLDWVLGIAPAVNSWVGGQDCQRALDRAVINNAAEYRRERRFDDGDNCWPAISRPCGPYYGFALRYAADESGWSRTAPA